MISNVQLQPIFGTLPAMEIARVRAGSVLYPPGGKYGPRIQENLQLVLLHTGSMTVHVDNEVYSASAGEVALLHPKHRELFYFSTTAETWHRWVDVLPCRIPSEWQSILATLPFSIKLSSHMNELVDILFEMTQNPNYTEQRDVMNSLGYSAVLLYISESQSSAPDMAQHPSVSMVKSIIHTRYAEPLTLDNLASATNVCPEHLIRLFRKSEGITPIKYLWKVRVMRAVELLQSTGLNLTEIIDQTGFQTTHHLSRLVKEHTGHTPSELRQGDVKWSVPWRSEEVRHAIDGSIFYEKST